MKQINNIEYDQQLVELNNFGSFEEEAEEVDEEDNGSNAQDIAMEIINRIFTEEQKKDLKEGKCFFCKKTGHFTRECPTKRNNNSNRPKNVPRPQFNRGKRSFRPNNRSNLMKQINNIIADSPPEEVAETYDYFAEQDDDDPIARQVKDFA